MIRTALLSILLLAFAEASAQSNHLPVQPNPADSSQFLYEFSMRYVGSSTSIDMNYRYILESIAELLEKNPGWSVHIRGHVCCGPSQKVSDKRAKTVYIYLIKNGVDPAKLSFKGYSDTMPLRYPEKTEEDADANRRVDFIIHRGK